MSQYTFRLLHPTDSIEQLTELLHLAYAEHAAAGRRFFATFQTPDQTRKRIAGGECWLAIENETMVGSVTLTPLSRAPPGYPAAAHGTFSQLAVHPEHRRNGLGASLLALAETRINALGTSLIVIDTSSQATELIAWYEKRGYSRIGVWQWSVTNYQSVVLSKRLSDGT